MLFSSWEFILGFLPLVWAGFFLLARYRLNTLAEVWLFGASLFFYAWWNFLYLPLILGSLLFNFAVGRQLVKPAVSSRTRKFLLVFGLVINLSLLAYFKYADFLIANVNNLTGSSYALLGVVLPLGISFFTFQKVAYLVDCYRGQIGRHGFIEYGLFITFFPQLIAGPICHHKELIPQFANYKNHQVDFNNVLCGLVFFSIGLFKKVAIADTFGAIATQGFDNPLVLDFFAAWVTSLSYTFQLYFDFSGYCDMATGAALLFNIRLPINFYSPYKALNIQDFWRRWHVTLGRFLRDYLYIPMGGNQSSHLRTAQNVVVTFVLGGLWHGADWLFVLWGALHGVALVVYRVWKRVGTGLPLWLSWFLTFFFVNIAWVFFRAKTMPDAMRVLKGMFGMAGWHKPELSSSAISHLSWAGINADNWMVWMPERLLVYLPELVLITVAFWLVGRRNAFEITSNSLSWSSVFAASLLMALGMYVSVASKSTVFLYFNF